MIELMKHTYLMDVNKIEEQLEKLFEKYQEILNNPNWEGLNESRAILYLTGHIYCEKIAVEAIERRLPNLDKPLELNEFLVLIDSGSEKIEEHRKDEKFVVLEKFYNVVKKFKNKHIQGSFYRDEERFIKLYNQFAPSDLLKTSYKGNKKHKNHHTLPK